MGSGDLANIGGGAAVLLALVAIGLGLLNCFFGYRIFRFMLGVYGFILGAAVGLIVAGAVTEGQALWLILGALLGGLVGAALISLLYIVGVFVVGAVAGVLLVGALGGILNIDMPTLVVLIGAVAAGVIAVIFQRVAIILATAFSGAWAAVSGLAAIFMGRDVTLTEIPKQMLAGRLVGLPLLLMLVLWLALSIAGAVVQFRTTDGKPAKAPQE
jgi:hypothetical protein